MNKEEDKDKIMEVLKEKVENATQEELQKSNLILKSFEKVREQERERILKLIDELAQFTCECRCVDFDGKFCERCGKKYKYGEVDYDELMRKLKEQEKEG